MAIAKKGEQKIIPAPLWKRLFAYAVDLIVVNFVIFPPFKPYFPVVVESASWLEAFKSFYNISFAWNMILISTVLAILTILYWTLLEWKLGQSAGKILIGIHVVAGKNKANFFQCLIRNATKISPAVLFLDCLYLFKTKNLRYFEKLSGTMVVERLD